MDLTAELGIREYIGIFKHERALAKHTWSLYTGDTLKSRSIRERMLSDLSIFDADTYEPEDFSCLNDSVSHIGTTEC